jgi:hypothetical protein
MSGNTLDYKLLKLLYRGNYEFLYNGGKELLYGWDTKRFYNKIMDELKDTTGKYYNISKNMVNILKDLTSVTSLYGVNNDKVREYIRKLFCLTNKNPKYNKILIDGITFHSHDRYNIYWQSRPQNSFAWYFELFILDYKTYFSLYHIDCDQNIMDIFDLLSYPLLLHVASRTPTHDFPIGPSRSFSSYPSHERYMKFLK